MSRGECKCTLSETVMRPSTVQAIRSQRLDICIQPRAGDIAEHMRWTRSGK